MIYFLTDLRVLNSKSGKPVPKTRQKTNSVSVGPSPATTKSYAVLSLKNEIWVTEKRRIQNAFYLEIAFLNYELKKVLPFLVSFVVSNGCDC